MYALVYLLDAVCLCGCLWCIKVCVLCLRYPETGEGLVYIIFIIIIKIYGNINLILLLLKSMVVKSKIWLLPELF